MPDAKPEVRIRNTAGKLFVFKATKTARVGSYRARVVFPKAGRYSLGVYDGFPVRMREGAHLQVRSGRRGLKSGAAPVYWPAPQTRPTPKRTVVLRPPTRMSSGTQSARERRWNPPA